MFENISASDVEFRLCCDKYPVDVSIDHTVKLFLRLNSALHKIFFLFYTNTNK